MANILVVGSLNIDLTLKSPTLVRKGETILADELVYGFGGKGANQALAVAKLGGQVKMLGCIGEDEQGAKLLHHLASYGVDVGSVQKVAGSTGLAVISVAHTGENQIVVVPAANKACTIDYIKANMDALQESDFILLQLEIPTETVDFLIKEAKRLGKTVILNPAPALAHFPRAWLSQVDYLTPNETECQLLVKDLFPHLNINVEHLDQLKPLTEEMKHLILTRGGEGVYYQDKESAFTQAAYKVSVVDTVAAGDCFNGAFVVALAEKQNIQQALSFACAAAALAVQKEGAQASIPSRAELDAFLKETTK